MQLIEAALAFAITMLVLSLVVSSFVELVHRIFSMREAGLQHMLGQMFDQVIAQHIINDAKKKIDDPNLTAAQKEAAQAAINTIDTTRKHFVERMRANRAPMGATPKATPTDAPAKVEQNRNWAFNLWSGRDLSAMTPAEFMERLGSMDVGQAIANANKAANVAYNDTANKAADMADTVLKDVAQKFEALGKEASVYFEGRARLLSVAVAIALAFLAHVDAVDLFRTYLRDPNARAKVIEQAQAVTEQHKAAAVSAEALTKLADLPTETKDEVKKQVEALKEDMKTAIANAKGTIKQYADLGVPLGWTDDRIDAAKMYLLAWTCIDPKTKESEGFSKFRQTCPKDDDTGYTGLKSRQYMDVWIQFPTRVGTWFFLFLGGLLIGLGSPFWYGAVTSLTELRNGAKGTAPAAPPTVAAGESGKAQPATPVGVFQVSKLAKNEAGVGER